jgi:hypothetical protein
MLDDGVQPIDVFAFMAGPPLIMNPSTTSGTIGSTIEQQPNAGHPGFQQAPWAPLPLDLSVQPAAHQMTQPVKKEPEHGHASTYVSMHQRFDQGRLAQSIEQERPMDTMPMMGHPSMAQSIFGSHGAVTTVQATTPTMQNPTMETQNTEPERQGANLALEDNNMEQDITPTIETAGDTVNAEKTEKPDRSRGNARRKRCEARPSLRGLYQVPQEMRTPRSDVPDATASSRYIVRYTKCCRR